MVNPYTTFVFKDNDGYYVAKSTTGELLTENNNAPEAIIKTALDRKGRMYLQGDFLCSTGLATQGGLKLKSDTLIDFGPETWIRVPNGYSGNLWVADYTYDNASLWNTAFRGTLYVDEQGSPARNWNALGLLLKDPGSPTSRGITMCDFGHMFVNNARSGVNFDLQHAAGWVTSCNFENIKLFTTKRALEFVNTAAVTTVPGISSNNFKHIWFQSSSINDYGVKDVMGRNLWFTDVAIWDLQVSNDGGGAGTGHSASFTPYCSDIFVEGGIMMYYNLVNNATKGKVRFMDAHSTTQVWQYYEELTLAELNGSAIGSKVYTIAHGLGYSPDWVDVIPKSKDALTSPITWNWNSTNITITFQGTPPPPATAGNQGNVKFAWRASTK